MPKRVVILGSTGSIGCSALEVADNLPGKFEIAALAAGSSWERMAEQVERYRPRVVVLTDATAAEKLSDHIRTLGGDTRVWSGADAPVRLVKELECDFVLSAIVGVAGLPATLAAVERGLPVGLANKESLVVAGELIVSAAARSGSRLLPVDSEHSAIYQSLQAGRREEVERIFLTASGGPFRTWTFEQMRRATLQDAMRHPTWDMGPKITIDSATMMNKALEIVEAKWLFGIDPDRIEVVIHPESIIHSMVAFHDGSIVAQMGRPDMRTPIQYAMTYPRRLAGCGTRLDFSKLERMQFEPPDVERFGALRLGQEVARAGGTAGAAMNAANEAAVEAFREGHIGFLDIVPMVADCLERHKFERLPSLATLMAVDAWARKEVASLTSVFLDA
ncbi:MAG: 1-deoxy-D-xylulose-5-phosphate reductoisomerase [Phycisphaerae bacterium]|nr:1-deoxy-D-xylulose-5-phosphate reductoisomerase [Phycisphaerae bacterium]